MPIRCLHLFHSYLNVTQNWSFNLLSELQDAEVVIAAREYQKRNFYNPDFEYIEFPILLLPSHPINWGKTIYNKFARAARSAFYQQYIAGNAVPVDLIHSHFATVGWEHLKVVRRLRVPHLVSFYGYDYERLPQTVPIWRRRYRKLFREADIFLCEGTHAASLLERQGCPPERIRVARLGVRTGNIEVAPRTKQPGELHLVQVASMTEKKGHVYALQAFLRASEGCPNTTLTFVGSDKAGEGNGISAQLRQTVVQAGLEDRVIFIPGIDFAHLHRFLAEYHVFLHPSVYATNRDSEGGAPIVLLDAQATGMPVIATTHCDIPDEVVDGTTGLLAAERDVETLAHHIRRFYEMGQEEYDGFAAAARNHVEKNYDIRQNAAGLRRIYDEVLARR